MHRHSLVVGTLLVLVLLVGLSSAGRADEESSDPGDAVVEMVTTEPLAIQDFLRAVGRIADMPFLWDPNTKELARAEFVSAKNLQGTRREFFAFVRSILASYDLALVPIGPKGYQVYRVTAVRDLGGAATVQPSVIALDRDNAGTYRTQHGVLVTTTFRTRHIRDLASARTALMVHATRGGVGRIETLPDLPGFAVTDFAPAVVTIRDALLQLDAPPPEPQVPARVTVRVDLEHAVAEATASGLAAQLGANLPLPAREAMTAEMRRAPPLGLRILADERTNALLVSGSPDRVAEVQEAVTLLDVPGKVLSSWIHVYRLKHRDAVPTALALRELAAGSGVLRAGDGAPPPTIVAVEQGNALLVEATPRVWEQLLSVVQEIDEPEPEDAEER